MQRLIPLALAAALLPVQTLLAHPGHHHGGWLAELRHTLSHADHALPLFLGLFAVAALFYWAFSRGRRRSRGEQAARHDTH